MRDRDGATDVGTPRSRPAVFAGVGGGLAAATCCVGPAIGIASGTGAGSFLLAMGRYRPVLFVIGGFSSVAIAAAMVRGRRRTACPTPHEYQRLRSQWLTVALVAFAFTLRDRAVRYSPTDRAPVSAAGS